MRRPPERRRGEPRAVAPQELAETTHVAAYVFVDGLLLIQRRSAERAFLPGAWDVVGGAVEPGETDLEALRREVREEVGLDVVEVSDPITVESFVVGDRPCLERGYVVRVADGRPRPEPKKASGLALVDSIDAFVEDNVLRGFGDHLARTAGVALSTARRPPAQGDLDERSAGGSLGRR